jgi:alcohol dehydrogenase
VSSVWWLRQAKALGNPAGLAAGRIMLERAAPDRARRLREASVDRARQRLRPTRPRMRALILHPGGRLAWRSVAAPAPPGPLEAIVHPIAVATCDMDRPIGLGATPFITPLAFGHECVAEVLAVGSDVELVRPGQRVVVPFEISCGACPACRVGRTANCQKVPPISMYGFGLAGGHWGGAVADELAVPFADAMLIPLPHRIQPTAAASVADNVCDAYRHIGPHLPGLLERDPDASVLIAGASSRRHLFTAGVSLYAGLIAKALGAKNVTLMDARPEIREQARSLGLDAIGTSREKKLTSAPLVADVSASRAGLRRALNLTSPDGVCSSSGLLHASTRIPTTLMFGRNVTLIIARAHVRPAIPEVLKLMVDDRLHPESVTTVVAPMDDAPAALSEHMRGQSTKTIVATSS